MSFCGFASTGSWANTILVMGDSLSAGYGLSTDQAWPVLLEKKLLDEKLPYTVANASISGETTAGGRARLQAALKQHTPTVCILELGANDGLRGLPISAMRANLDEMARTCTQAKAKLLIIGMRMPPNYGLDYTQKFQQAYADVAATYKAALVPFIMEGFADKRDLFQGDGIHPTAQAQPMILSNIWPALKPLLKR